MYKFVCFLPATFFFVAMTAFTSSTQAKANIESYLTTTAPEKIQPEDYLFASVLKYIQGCEEGAINYLQIALNHDTVRSNQFLHSLTMML